MLTNPSPTIDRGFLIALSVSVLLSLIPPIVALMAVKRQRRAFANGQQPNALEELHGRNAFKVFEVNALEWRQVSLEQNIELTDTSNSSTHNPGDKFSSPANSLIMGSPQAAVAGISSYIGADISNMPAPDDWPKIRNAVVTEWKVATSNSELRVDMLENLIYVLYGKAGKSEKTFQHGWIRDRSPDGQPLKNRMRNRKGMPRRMVLRDFEEDAPKEAKHAGLKLVHVFVLRLYTTAAYKFINEPFRHVKRDKYGKPSYPLQLAVPHPLPITVHLIAEALQLLSVVHSPDNEPSKLRSVSRSSYRYQSQKRPAKDVAVESQFAMNNSLLQRQPSSRKQLLTASAHMPRVTHSMMTSVRWPQHEWSNSSSSDLPVLFRGVRECEPDTSFRKFGGCELSTMSTTIDIETAVRYARTQRYGLIFRFIPSAFMNVGANLSFLSAFPHEHEYLYPPLTYMQVRKDGVACFLEDDNGASYEVIDVHPFFPAAK